MQRRGEPREPDAAPAGPPPPRPLRVVVVDDSVAYGLLVSAWFGGDAEIDVVATLRTEHEALQTLTATRPDAVMLDHLLPSEEHSRRVIAHIRAELPGTAVILISGMPAADTHAIRMAIRAGCMGRVRDR